MAVSTAGTGLRAELAAVERQHRGWHAFLSDKGRCWAVTTHGYLQGSGITVDASTPEGLHHAIAVAERELLLAGAA